MLDKRRWFRSRQEIGAVLGVAIAAALWGIGFTLKGEVSRNVGTIFVIFGVLLFIISAIQFYRSRRAALTEESAIASIPEERRVALSIDLSVDDLAYAYPAKYPGALMNAGLLERSFGLLTVRNVGTRNAREITVECKVVESGATIAYHWSKESNGKFVLGGRHIADLNVGQRRVLLIAQVFGTEKLWASLPADPDDLFPDPIYGNDSLAVERGEAAWATSRAKEPLDLGRRCEITVTFEASGMVKHIEHLLVSFEGPAISRIPQEGHPKG